MALPNHLAIDIRTDDPLALSIKKKLESSATFQSRTTDRPVAIFRVPSHIRERHKNFYEPRLVSIGPYHRGSERLKCMEEQKLEYVKKMLYENPDVTLDDYLAVLRKLEPAAQRCYYEKFYMDSDEFVEMLLYDACFIIQLVVNWSFPDDDIVYDISWNIPLIKSDLLMLENQIPFFVLQNVFQLYSTRSDDTSDLISPSSTEPMSPDSEFDKVSLSEDSEPDKASLFDVLVEFLQHGNETFQVPEQDNNYDHLLDFYYQCYMRTQEFPMKRRKKFLPLKITIPKVFPIISSIRRLTMRRRLQMVMRKPRMISCATELQEAGITFKKADSKSIFNVHFSNGVLRIPYTPIEEATRPQIMNLIAFEQCSGQKHKPLSSYAVFMDCIVNTSRDVLILQQNEIIENKLADEKAAAEFFNQLRYCIYLDYEDHHLAELFKNVKKYCDSSWQKYRAKLHRDYFSNPWSIISFIAGIVLLLLTFLQTFYTVMPYYRPSH
ncbi:hypothetical protein LUZ62_057653 [Rhynchospora pubera]|uniref:Uncharacterized protein n=1 Tax=Rhynchospora pubera TaxID=906938 RepID=A0AAV8E533_9POAL|nr:hypothetical protein LUZ62_057653 [Rhynchospora pubera]